MTDDHDDTQQDARYLSPDARRRLENGDVFTGRECDLFDHAEFMDTEVERLRGEVEHWKKIALRNARERSEARAERDAMREVVDAAMWAMTRGRLDHHADDDPLTELRALLESKETT